MFEEVKNPCPLTLSPVLQSHTCPTCCSDPSSAGHRPALCETEILATLVLGVQGVAMVPPLPLPHGPHPRCPRPGSHLQGETTLTLLPCPGSCNTQELSLLKCKKGWEA